MGLCAILCLLAAALQDGTELRAAWGKPRSLDPAHAGQGPVEMRIAGALFEGLVVFGPDGVAVLPGVAERWEVSADGRTWTFHLRESRWSDGSRVTAGDFRFAWLRALDPAVGNPQVFVFAPIEGALAWWEDRRLDADLLSYAGEPGARRRTLAERFRERATQRQAPMLRSLASAESDPGSVALLRAAAEEAERRPDVEDRSVGVEAVDDRTLRVRLVVSVPSFLEELAGPSFLPVPEGVVRERRDPWTQLRHLVTNGPYRLEQATADELRLVRVRGGGPARATLLLTAHLGAAFEAFEKGRADWLEPSLVPPEKLRDLEARGLVRPYASFSTAFLRLNGGKGPMGKPGVRKAFALAVDRGRLLRQADAGAQAAVGLVPPGIPGYVGGIAPVQDVAAAVRLLLAEWPDLTQAPRFNLLGPKSASGILYALREQLERDLGIRIRTDLREGPAYEPALEKGDYDLAYVVWTGRLLDPEPFLSPFSEVEGLAELARAAAVGEGSERLKVLGRMETRLVQGDGPVVPLHTGGGFVALRPEVRMELNPLGRFSLRHVRVVKRP